VLADERPDAFKPQLAASLSNLANRLVEVGRREEARNIIEEAVGHYRALVAARPDAFNIDLARSLGILSDLYGEDAKSEIVASTLTESIQLLSPAFLRYPAQVRQMMAATVRRYVAHCDAVGCEPDMNLLGPVLAVFEKMAPGQRGNE
jgi:hypothetical protein